MRIPFRLTRLVPALALAAALTAPAAAQWPGRYADGHLRPPCMQEYGLRFNGYQGRYRYLDGGGLVYGPYHHRASRQYGLYQYHVNGKPSRQRWSYWWMENPPPAPAPGTARGHARAEKSEAGSGWQLLAGGRPDLAQRVFAWKVESNPRAGGSWIGYGLASALAGDEATAASALRKAFDVDPQAIHEVTVAGFRDDLQALVREYAPLVEAEPPDPDAAIVVTTAAYLLGDVPAARHAARRLEAAGNARVASMDRTGDPLASPPDG